MPHLISEDTISYSFCHSPQVNDIGPKATNLIFQGQKLLALGTHLQLVFSNQSVIHMTLCVMHWIVPQPLLAFYLHNWQFISYFVMCLPRNWKQVKYNFLYALYLFLGFLTEYRFSCHCWSILFPDPALSLHAASPKCIALCIPPPPRPLPQTTMHTY